MTGMARNSRQRAFVLQIPFQLTWTRRATYIKGDPYIRDMKHTRSIIHMYRLMPLSLTVAYFPLQRSR